MAVKKVKVILPLYEFIVDAGSAHEAAAVALGKIRKINSAILSTVPFIVIVDGKVFPVTQSLAEEWIARYANPQGPVQMIAFKRWEKSVEGPFSR